FGAGSQLPVGGLGVVLRDRGDGVRHLLQAADLPALAGVEDLLENGHAASLLDRLRPHGRRRSAPSAPAWRRSPVNALQARPERSLRSRTPGAGRPRSAPRSPCPGTGRSRARPAPCGTARPPPSSGPQGAPSRVRSATVGARPRPPAPQPLPAPRPPPGRSRPKPPAGPAPTTP